MVVRRTDMWQKEQVIHEFQKRGKRITGQREMLLDVILEGIGAAARMFTMKPEKGIRSLAWLPFTGR